MDPDNGEKERCPRKTTLNVIPGLSEEVKRELHKLLMMYYSGLSTDPQAGKSFAIQLENAIWRMADELALLGPIGGLLFDLSLFNFFACMKNYKVQNKATTRIPSVPLSQAIMKYVIERMIYATDRLFIRAPCSGLVIPKELANCFYQLTKEVRARACGSWRKLSVGRKTASVISLELVKCIGALDAQQKLSPEFKAFLKLSFPFVNPNNIVIPIHEQAAGFRATKGRLDFVSRPEGGTGSYKSLYTGKVVPDKYPIPDPMLLDMNDPSFLDDKMADVTPFLVNPQVILSTDPLMLYRQERAAMPVPYTSCSVPVITISPAMSTVPTGVPTPFALPVQNNTFYSGTSQDPLNDKCTTVNAGETISQTCKTVSVVTYTGPNNTSAGNMLYSGPSYIQHVFPPQETPQYNNIPVVTNAQLQKYSQEWAPVRLDSNQNVGDCFPSKRGGDGDDCGVAKRVRYSLLEEQPGTSQTTTTRVSNLTSTSDSDLDSDCSSEKQLVIDTDWKGSPTMSNEDDAMLKTIMDDLYGTLEKKVAVDRPYGIAPQTPILLEDRLAEQVLQDYCFD
ncbi:putative herpesvirus transcription activation factor [Saguinine gammaherpesvirus 1]|uniref:Herpesvirus transcription activation factor n=1 Tax=Saguinine gammaherpesvirus 1 TaxID=2169901 RepID=A0A9Q8QWW2_9GAMA|nr:putative herpesvirus transcription activation factor [Saguinine gammaherpesvirus 1]